MYAGEGIGGDDPEEVVVRVQGYLTESSLPPLRELVGEWASTGMHD